MYVRLGRLPLIFKNVINLHFLRVLYEREKPTIRLIRIEDSKIGPNSLCCETLKESKLVATLKQAKNKIKRRIEQRKGLQVNSSLHFLIVGACGVEIAYFAMCCQR